MLTHLHNNIIINACMHLINHHDHDHDHSCIMIMIMMHDAKTKTKTKTRDCFIYSSAAGPMGVGGAPSPADSKIQNFLRVMV